jgi:hypothetical protein
MTLHPHWREVLTRKETTMEVETICPMRDIRLPYRERLCKISKACTATGHTECRLRPAPEVK